MSREFRWRRVPLLVVAAVALAASVLSATPAASAPTGTNARGDVFIRDKAADTGAEPTTDPVWSSPDIKVCELDDLFATSAAACTPVNPLGFDDYVVVVTLNNPSPSTPVTGDLKLYYTSFGGAAQWPMHWTPIGTAVGVSAAVGITRVVLPWSPIPGPGHYCLLARWVSVSDPMHNPEGLNTLTNTRNNNNIAWRNIDVVKVKKLELHTVPFTLRNPEPRTLLTNLVFAQERQFAGRLVVDLGPALAERWRGTGARGAGVRQVGETTVEIVDPQRATIIGLPISPPEQFETRVLFQAGDAGGASTLRINQTDASGADLGGGQFDITVE